MSQKLITYKTRHYLKKIIPITSILGCTSAQTSNPGSFNQSVAHPNYLHDLFDYLNYEHLAILQVDQNFLNNHRPNSPCADIP